MRVLIALILLAGPASGWEFSPRPVCTLIHDEGAARVVVTHDIGRAEPYTISVSGAQSWMDGPVFSVTFKGARGLTISTDRHVLAGGTLSVSDSGFGNVLNGLEFNQTATATLGTQSVTVSLAGAAPEVRKFRACATAPVALSLPLTRFRHG